MSLRQWGPEHAWRWSLGPVGPRLCMLFSVFILVAIEPVACLIHCEVWFSSGNQHASVNSHLHHEHGAHEHASAAHAAHESDHEVPGTSVQAGAQASQGLAAAPLLDHLGIILFVPLFVIVVSQNAVTTWSRAVLRPLMLPPPLRPPIALV
jgi:hypothetical protein